jgi:hypothetical protein
MHVLNEGHWINFDKAKTLVRLDHERSRIYREAIEIEKRPHCLNTRDDALRLPATWKPLLTERHVIPTPPGNTPAVPPPPTRVDKRRKTPLGSVNTPAPRHLRSTRLAATAASSASARPPTQRGPARTETSQERNDSHQSPVQTEDRRQLKTRARAVIGRATTPASRCTRSQTRAQAAVGATLDPDAGRK